VLESRSKNERQFGSKVTIFTETNHSVSSLLARHRAKKIKHASAHAWFSSALPLTLAILRAFVVFFQHSFVTQDRKPTALCSGYGWLDAKNTTFDLHPHCACSIGERLKEHSESNTRARWRTINCNNKRTTLADVTTVAFTLSTGSCLVCPPKHNGCLQGEANGCSGYGRNIHSSISPLGWISHAKQSSACGQD
jgi:hypothetical protein